METQHRLHAHHSVVNTGSSIHGSRSESRSANHRPSIDAKEWS